MSVNGSIRRCPILVDVDGRRRIGLRSCNSRHRRQRGSARGQMQKLSAGKFRRPSRAVVALAYGLRWWDGATRFKMRSAIRVRCRYWHSESNA
jgi:hypothetical protein